MRKSGELFAGVGGLGMAMAEVLKTEPEWVAEFDEAPSKVLDARYPGVPNLGDVTKVSWVDLVPVWVMGGGFPCTDVSQAGRMAGLMEGTRSGLWSEYRLAIATLRPAWVVIENVRGLLTSRGAAPHQEWIDADADVNRWDRVLQLIDQRTHRWKEDTEYVARKRRERVRITRHRKRAVDRREREERLIPRAIDTVLRDLALIGFDAEWTGLRASDIGAPHGRFRVFILAWPRERTPSPDSGSGRSGGGPLHPDVARERGQTLRLTGQILAMTGDLLPTPAASNPNDGEDTDTWLARRARVKERIKNGNGMGMPLTIAAQLIDGERTDDDRPQGEVVAGTDWGPYRAAIERWERVLGRPAPPPVRHDGMNGKARLNPELTEWMMGWPAGWVTDPALGLSRAEQLKACGNGVVPQQAAYALREMLSREGVPSVG